MSWSHVTGLDMSRPAALAADSRYHSSCVLAQNGMATSSSFHVAPCSGPSSVSVVVAFATSSGGFARKPGSASSGTKGGSRLMMSMDVSPAARRRASCSRCDEASRGSREVWILYLPPDASEHCWARTSWPPSSGLMYQVSVGGPDSPLPHPVSSMADTAATAATLRTARGFPALCEW